MGSYSRLRADLLFRSSCDIGESPIFNPDTGTFAWIDMTNGLLHEAKMGSDSFETARVDSSVGAIALRDQKLGYAVVTKEGFGYFEEGKLTLRDQVLRDPHYRMNDGKVDTRGRLWAGSNQVDYADGQGALHRWWQSAEVHLIRKGLTLPNGMGWSVDDSKMYLVDSYAHLIYQANYEPDTGEVGEFKPFIDIPDGYPDGLAIDAEGGIWVAVWGVPEVHHYSHDGRLIGLIDLPVTQPTSCAFGPGRALLITSAKNGLTDSDLREQPLAGSVFCVDAGVEGAPIGRFQG